MIRIFILFCLLFLSIVSFSQSPILTIKPGGHTALIRSMTVTNDGNYIVAAGDDKAVKVWSLQTGEVVKEFLGEIGLGSAGIISSIALSPDNKYLAVGGSFATDMTSMKGGGDVRIYDFKTKKIVALLTDNALPVNTLAFSPDGKLLATGNKGKTIRTYSMDNFKLQKTMEGHEREVWHLCFAGNKKVVSCSLDGTVKLWNAEKGKEIASQKLHTGMITRVAASKDGKRIYSSGEDKQIIEYDEDLKKLTIINSTQMVSSLTLSDDGLKMLVGGWSKPFLCEVYLKKNDKWVLVSAYKGHDHTIPSCVFVKDKMVATAGGLNNEIHCWNYQDYEDGNIALVQQSAKLVGYGQQICAVGFKDEKIGFADYYCSDQRGKADLTTSFNLFTHEVLKIPAAEEKSYGDIMLTLQGVELKHAYYDEFGLADAMLQLVKDGKPVLSILRNDFSGFNHASYTFTNQTRIVSGGTGNIHMYSGRGDLLGEFVGHAGEVIALWVSPDGKRMISGGYDQTMRIWDLTKVSNTVKLLPPDKILPATKATYKKLFPNFDIETSEGIEKIYNALRDNGAMTTLSWFLCEPRTYEPIASVFIGADNEWVMWSNDGYFTSSRKGSRYIGFHVNQGSDKEAKFYPFEQFDLKLNRPDIIYERLALGDKEYSEMLLAAHNKRVKKMGMKEEDLSGDMHVPEVIIESESKEVNEKNFQLIFDAVDEKYDLDRVNVYVNDVPIYGKDGISLKAKAIKKTKQNLSIELLPGKNKIQVSALNVKGVESLKETISVFYKTADNNEKPTLYIVTIGTSKYTDANYNLNYAAKDAQDVAKLFADAKGANSPYANVVTKTLTNEQVTKESIKQLKTTLAGAKVNDVVMIFVAGHGLLDEKFDYYFATHNIDFNKPGINGIAYEEIESLLDGIKAIKKMLFMDTCHSGEVDKDDVVAVANTETEQGNVMFRAVGATVKEKSASLKKTSELMKEMFTDLRRGTGATIISSAGGAEFAMESADWKNGLFTYCMLHGLKDKAADLNKDGEVWLSELQNYLTEEVRKLSKGKQVPTARSENLVLDYRVW
ncbi:MAG: caspase family protein [Bacteroidetes bacterium]|nr:caspase family protein [Bacteroidota bacterium]